MQNKLKNRLKEIRDYCAIKRSGLFDCEYYLRHNLDVARSCRNPIMHYIRHGWREGRNPNKYFNTQWYLKAHPDIEQSGMNPLYHYFKYVAAEKQTLCPVFDTRGDLPQNPDVAIVGVQPLWHLLQTHTYADDTVSDLTQKIPIICDLKGNGCLVFSHNLDSQEGGPNSLFELCQGLKSASTFDPVVVSPVDGGLRERYEKCGIPVVIAKELLSPFTSLKVAYDHVQLQHKLCAILKEFKFSTVIVNTALGFHVAHAATIIGLPVIWIIRESEKVGSHFAAALSDQWRNIFLQCLSKVDRLVFVSGYTQQSWIKGAQISRLYTRVIPNGINIDHFKGCKQLPRDSMRGSLGVSAQEIMLLNVGTICDRKNQKELIDALELLSSTELAQIKVFIVGARCGGAKGGSAASEYAEVLTRRIKNSRVLRDRVFIIDETVEVQMYFLAADVFVFTSKLESYPRVILEAMYFKLPLISSPVFGVLEQTEEGMNALYYELGDPSSLAACIRAMLSRDRRQALSQGSERLFNKLPQYEHMVNSYIALLNEIREIGLKNNARLGHYNNHIKTSFGLGSDKHYSHWLQMVEKPNTEAKSGRSLEISLLRKKPKISVLVPVFNPELKLFKEMIDSVFDQIYYNWELCLSDDASTNPAVKTFLRELEHKDSRIKLCFREHNGHISNCLNSALEMASGEFCVLLDQDDLLGREALFHLVKELEYNPNLNMVYSDEDKITAEGKRYDPYFKTDFNYELLLTHNYMTHFAAYRTDLLRKLEGYRSEFDGAQDLDMTLRVIENILPQQICHIPLILYHWRAIPGSTALSHKEKPYQGSAGRLSVAAHLKRQGVSAKITTGFKTNFRRVVYELLNPLPKVSLIIPTRDKANLLKKCLESILKLSTYPNYEILIVDNNSKERSTSAFFESLTEESRIRVLRYVSEFNYSAINNWAVRQVRGDILGFVNNDIEVITPQWLEEMVRYAIQPSVGIVGAKLYYPNNTIQHAGILLGIGRVARHLYQYMPPSQAGHYSRSMLAQEISAVTGACMVMRRSVFEELDGFNEKNLKKNYSDVDLCLRARVKGYRIVWTPHAELYHHESISRREMDVGVHRQQPDDEVAFMWKRWGDVLTCDPYMNPNLEYMVDQKTKSPTVQEFKKLTAFCNSF